ncbi:MAG: hypothetical protein AseanaTS_04730 [Candidatus Pelagadaptatus aseana]|uniref:GNAT family N-acetyltransferase n=1 Tax=Candidatus Pelagadaptatus aseana TaxID=3120508 RepID=UPI0039B33646
MSAVESGAGDYLVEQLDSQLLPLVNKFYKSCRYSAKAGREDVVFVVRSDQQMIAAVRLQYRQDGVYFLRSMCVAPEYRRQGVGTVLLNGMLPFLTQVLCYCYPFDHLESFYAQSGFTTIAPEAAEPYMLEAYHRYLKQGRKLLLMVRHPG